CFFLLLTFRPPISTLFPYTTLFRSFFNISDILIFQCIAFILQMSEYIQFPAVFSTQYVRSEIRMDGQYFKIRVLIQSGEIHSGRSEEHTSELQSRFDLVCRLLLEKK